MNIWTWECSLNNHFKLILLSSFESKREQDSCVWPVTRGSIWNLDLKVQEMNYHHKVILQIRFESKTEQDSCVWPVTRGSIWHLDLKVQNLKYHHNVILQSSFESYFTKKCRNQLIGSGISRSLCLFSEKECVNDRE